MSKVQKLVETINKNSNSKVKTDYVFLGYFMLLYFKLMLENTTTISQEDMYKYLYRTLQETGNGFIIDTIDGEYELQNSFKLNHIEEVINCVVFYLEYCKTLWGEEVYERTLENWNVLGFKQIQEDFINNRTGLQRIVEEFDKIDHFGIEDLIDLYEQLNMSDRRFNDFYTPEDISDSVSKITIVKNIDRYKSLQDKGELVKIYDPTCGCGRLLYSGFKELKKRGIENILVFGSDIYKPSCVFTKSIFELVNYNNNHIFEGNSLVHKFPIPQMDLVLGNPPFGPINEDDYINILNISRYEKETFGSDISFDSSIEKKLKNITPLSDFEYENITSGYKEI